MALSDNLAFLHLGDAEDPDYPASGWTVTAPGALAKSTITGSAPDTYFDCSDGNAISFAHTAALLSVSTGSFTVACKIRVDTVATGETHVSVGNDSSRTWCLTEISTAEPRLIFVDEALGITSLFVEDGSYDHPGGLGTDIVVVFGRDSSQSSGNRGFLWINGTLYDSTDINGLSTRDYSSFFDPSLVTFGSLRSGSNGDDGRVYWVAVWDRALTSTEIQNNMNKTDLAAMLGGGSDPEGRLKGGKLIRGGLLRGGVL